MGMVNSGVYALISIVLVAAHLKSVPLVSSSSCEAPVEDWLAFTNGTSRV